MTLGNLENLVRIGKLRAEPPAQQEFDGLLKSGRSRLADAQVKGVSQEGKFDLTYNAAHAFALAAMRWHGYRSENRYLVFQCLVDTLGIASVDCRVLAKCHERRNRLEYTGEFEIDDQLMLDLARITAVLQQKASELGPVQ
jgi:hypothetical protein